MSEQSNFVTAGEMEPYPVAYPVAYKHKPDLEGLVSALPKKIPTWSWEIEENQVVGRPLNGSTQSHTYFECRLRVNTDHPEPSWIVQVVLYDMANPFVIVEIREQRWDVGVTKALEELGVWGYHQRQIGALAERVGLD